MLYFAYGSNLDPEQMRQRCPAGRAVGVARLPGYRLCFPRKSATRGCGVASIEKAVGTDVWGVVYELEQTDLAALDRSEGYVESQSTVSNRYNRESIQVEIEGALVSVETYFANVEGPMRPSGAYLDHLRRGARAHGLPANYIAMLDALIGADEEPHWRLFRWHLRQQVSDLEPTMRYCLDQGVIGLGWGITGFYDDPLSADDFLERHRQEQPNQRVNRSVSAFMGMKLNDLVWFRDKLGRYYLARVTSDWRSWNDAQAHKLDLRNVRSAEIVEVGSEEGVPGKVIAAFRSGRTVSAIASPTALHYSEAMFNRIVGRIHYPQQPEATADVFDLMDDQDLEDLVLVYLQTKGWILIPSSRRRTTIRYEATLVDKSTGARAYPQVKSGQTKLAPSKYEGDHRVFLFAGGGYAGATPKNVTTLTKEELLAFCRDRPMLLPSKVRFWCEHLTLVRPN